MEKNQKAASEMTAAELEQLLAEKKKAETAAQRKIERDHEAEKDEFVVNTLFAFEHLNTALKDLKNQVVSEGNRLHSEMYEVYGKEPKELKRFTIKNEAGTAKVTIEIAERQAFDERAEVAINEIKDLLRDKFEGRHKGMYKIIDDILSSNSKGDYDPKLVSKLRRHEETINDPRFSKALDLLAKSFVVDGSALYARVHRLNSATNKWEDVTLNFSSL